MFVTLEGPEGAGKSTLLRSLASALRGLGHSVVETREPGATEAGKAIRRLLLESGDVSARAELLLFLADRALHVEQVIKPALARGDCVLCDRYADSTVVYQGHARGLEVPKLKEWNGFATGGLVPDLTLLLDLEPEVGLARDTKGDRLDRESLEFHRKVRDGFLKEAYSDPKRWVVLDASRAPAEVLAEALAVLTSRKR